MTHVNGIFPMQRKLIVLSFVALSACTGFEIPDFRTGPIAVPAPEPTPAPVVNPRSAKERFVTAVEQNGCVLDQGNSVLILEQATLSREDLARVMTELKTEGRGRVTADQTGFQVISAVCPT